MKKSWKFKQWVVNTLIIINFIAIMFMGAECDDMDIVYIKQINYIINICI